MVQTSQLKRQTLSDWTNKKVSILWYPQNTDFKIKTQIG